MRESYVELIIYKLESLWNYKLSKSSTRATLGFFAPNQHIKKMYNLDRFDVTLESNHRTYQRWKMVKATKPY